MPKTRVPSAPNKALNTWLESRPQAIRDLAAEFEPGFCFTVDGDRYYVIGYEEGDVLQCSMYNPFDHYDKAVQHLLPIHAKHLRKPRQ